MRDTDLDRLRHVGDPPADAAMEAVLGDGDLEQASAALRTLVDADLPAPGDLPPELETFLADTVALPDWADPKLIERGQRFFELWGVQISVSLFCASLPSAYAAANGVRVLHLTARLDTDTRRRIMETGQFLMDVLHPGALHPDGGGQRAIQRTRLMHATIRALIRRRAASTPGMWDPDAWGTPINQEDLAGTLQSFAFVVGEPLPRLGVAVTDADAQAYLHLWNVIGHQLGVQPELLPPDMDQARDLVHTIRRRQQRPSADGAEMAAALVRFLEDMTPMHRADKYIPSLIRHLIGDDVADMIAIPEGAPPGGPVRRLLDGLLAHGETDVERESWLQRLAEPFGRELLSCSFRVERRGTRRPFELPSGLARTWQLDAAPA